MDKHFYGLTDTGKTRDNNEDTFIAESFGTKQMILAAVIDGVGGYHGGEVAAAITKEEILKKFSSQPTEVISQMITALKQANSVILSRKELEKEHAEMACVATLVCADIENNQFYYAHVGDTRLYLLRDGSLIKISKDHSFVGFLEDSGRINEDTAMKHPKRNEINKAIGFNDAIDADDSYIETGQSPFLPGDLLLLCSDGLTDMVDKKDITTIITQSGTLAQKAGDLVALANENGGRDNITVVLVKNDKHPQKVKPITHHSSPRIEDSVTATTDQEEIAVPVAKTSKFHLAVLAILCILLLASTVFLYLQNQKNQSDHLVVNQPIKQARNSQEQLLQDAIDHVFGDTLVLSDTIFKSPIIITDTIRIRKDTLFIFAKGLVLQAHNTYKGAALTTSAQSKIVSIDSLQFKDFTTVIAVKNVGIKFNNVSFINCGLPIQNNYNLRGMITPFAKPMNIKKGEN